MGDVLGPEPEWGVAMRGVCHVLFALCAVLVSSGPVSAADEELATVGGKVIYNGEALTDSTITFYLKDGQFVGGRIKDGKFRVDRVPVGPVKVTIESNLDFLRPVAVREDELPPIGVGGYGRERWKPLAASPLVDLNADQQSTNVVTDFLHISKWKARSVYVSST